MGSRQGGEVAKKARPTCEFKRLHEGFHLEASGSECISHEFWAAPKCTEKDPWPKLYPLSLNLEPLSPCPDFSPALKRRSPAERLKITSWVKACHEFSHAAMIF